MTYAYLYGIASYLTLDRQWDISRRGHLQSRWREMEGASCSRTAIFRERSHQGLRYIRAISKSINFGYWHTPNARHWREYPAQQWSDWPSAVRCAGPLCTFHDWYRSYFRKRPRSPRVILFIFWLELFSTSLQTLSLPIPQAHNVKLTSKGITTPPGSFGVFTTAFEEIQDIIIARRKNDLLWPLFEWWEDKVEEPMKVLKEWLDPIVRDVIERNKRRKKEMGVEEKTLKEDDCSFLEFLAETTDGEAYTVNSRTPLMHSQMWRWSELKSWTSCLLLVIRWALITLFERVAMFILRDKTNSLLTFVIYIFTQHPEVVARIRGEILDICPLGKLPSYNDLKGMRYRE